MRRPPQLFVLGPIILVLIAYLRARWVYSRDPTSCFFDRATAYRTIYSQVRKAEADSFIEGSKGQPFHRQLPADNTTKPLLCVGIPTVARPGGYVYVRSTIGSLLAGLTTEERNQIHLMPFIAHSNPGLHPITTEPWLANVADQILTYNALDTQAHVNLHHIEELEKDKENREKQVFDYAYMLEACHQVNASYVVTFEDDILAMDGWFHRTKAGLQKVEEQTKILGLSPFFYLRLFYTEQTLGWNAEFWPYYLSYSLLVTIIALTAVLTYLRKTQSIQRRLPLLALTTLYCAVAIGFFFASGRVSMLPMATGVHQMPKYACCAQGLVYNPAWVPRLITWYRDRRLGYVDNLAEELADTREVGERWALTPSVIQHVGTFSTKGEDEEADARGEVSVSQQRWNFAFETNQAKYLKMEHDRAVHI